MKHAKIEAAWPMNIRREIVALAPMPQRLAGEPSERSSCFLACCGAPVDSLWTVSRWEICTMAWKVGLSENPIRSLHSLFDTQMGS